MKTGIALSIMATLCGTTGAMAAPIPIARVQRVAPVDFERDIKPILKANCTSCHNKTTTKSELNLETPELMIKGGESGAGLISGKGGESSIVLAAAHVGESPMPPKGNKVGAVNLTPEELGLLKLWIDQGAKAGEPRVEHITWQPLPPGLNPIYSVAIAPEGDIAACGRANQILVYDLPARRWVTKLDDPALAKSGLYKNPGVAHRDLVASLAFSPDGTRMASGSYREVKLWKQTIPAPVVAKIATAPRANEGSMPNPKIDAAMKLIAKKPDRPALLHVARAQRNANAVGLEVTSLNEVIQKNGAEIKALDDRIKKSTDAKTAAEKSLPEKKKAAQSAAEARTAAEKVAQESADLLAKAPKDKPDEALVKRDKESQDKLKAADKKLADDEAAVKSAETAITDADADIKSVTDGKGKIEKVLADANEKLQKQKQSQEQATKDLAAARKTATESAAPVKTATLSLDDSLLATAHEDGAIRLWSAGSGAPVATWKTPLAGITVLEWRDAGVLFAAAPDGSTWSLQTGRNWTLERTFGGGDEKSPVTDRANVLRFSHDGKQLVVGSGEPSRSGDITVWEVATGKLLHNWPDRHRDSVLGLDFSPDGRLIASGGADRALRVLDAVTGKQLKMFEGHTHHVLGVAWRADGRELASAGADNMVKVWDFLSGERKKNIEGWDKEVTSILNLGASDQFVTASGDNKIRVVRGSGSEVRVLPGVTAFMECVAVTQNGEVIVAGGQDGKLRVWETESGKELVVFDGPAVENR